LIIYPFFILFIFKKKKKKKKKDQVFGVDIEVQAKLEGRLIPRIVTTCVNAVEKRGLNFEGIYRISGTTSQIEKLRSLFRYGR